MVPPCHKICKRHLFYLHHRKRNKFCNLALGDLISNNLNLFLTYPGTTHLLPLTVSFLEKRKQMKIFSMSPYIEHAVLPKFEIFWKCNFPLNLSREGVVSIEGMSFILVTYSFCFIYFCFIPLLQEIITNLQKIGLLFLRSPNLAKNFDTKIYSNP